MVLLGSRMPLIKKRTKQNEKNAKAKRGWNLGRFQNIALEIEPYYFHEVQKVVSQLFS